MLTDVERNPCTASLQIKRANYCLHIFSTFNFSWYTYHESSTTINNEAYQTTDCLLALNLNQNMDDGNMTMKDMGKIKPKYLSV